MIEWPATVFIVSLLILQETWGSGQSLPIVGKRFWLLSQKAKTPSRDWTALLFASLTTICFAFWESILRFMLQASGGVWISIVGALVLFAVMGWRSTRYRELKQAAWPMSSREWTAVVAGTCLLLHGWTSALIFTGWVYWRSLKVLPRT